MRKTGLYIILGIIISITVFVLAGILYFKPGAIERVQQEQIVQPSVPAGGQKSEPETAPVTVKTTSPVQGTVGTVPSTPGMKTSVSQEPQEKESADGMESIPERRVPPAVVATLTVKPYEPEIMETVSEAEVISESPVAGQMSPVEAEGEVVSEAEEIVSGEITSTREDISVDESVEVTEIAPAAVAAEVPEPVTEEKVSQIEPETVVEETKKLTPDAEPTAVMSRPASDVESVEMPEDSRIVAPAPEPFTPSASALWVVKNSMPRVMKPEIIIAPPPMPEGEAVFTPPSAFLAEAETRRKDAVDQLFDKLQF